MRNSAAFSCDIPRALWAQIRSASAFYLFGQKVLLTDKGPERPFRYFVNCPDAEAKALSMCKLASDQNIYLSSLTLIGGGRFLTAMRRSIQIKNSRGERGRMEEPGGLHNKWARTTFEFNKNIFVCRISLARGCGLHLWLTKSSNIWVFLLCFSRNACSKWIRTTFVSDKKVLHLSFSSLFLAKIFIAAGKTRWDSSLCCKSWIHVNDFLHIYNFLQV